MLQFNPKCNLVCLPHTDTFRLSASQVQQHISKIDINSISKENFRSPIHLEAVMYLWSHIQLQTYTHRVLAYYRTFLPEPIPTVRGMRLFVILLEKTASPHFHYGHHFIPPGLPGILCVFWKVRVLALCCEVDVGISCCHVEVEFNLKLK